MELYSFARKTVNPPYILPKKIESLSFNNKGTIKVKLKPLLQEQKSLRL